ncbi:MAG: lipoprotein [Patescibacteria group bacterium]|jgi:hypothetical protein
MKEMRRLAVLVVVVLVLAVLAGCGRTGDTVNNQPVVHSASVENNLDARTYVPTTWEWHTVQDGEWISHIASTHVAVEKCGIAQPTDSNVGPIMKIIRELNPEVEDFDVLSIGQQLRVPKGCPLQK